MDEVLVGARQERTGHRKENDRGNPKIEATRPNGQSPGSVPLSSFPSRRVSHDRIRTLGTFLDVSKGR